MKITIVCLDCNGTGVYTRDHWLPAGKLCNGCDGSGAQVLRVTPFKKRRGSRKVKTVHVRTDDGGWETMIPYKEFLRQYPAGKADE